MALNFVVSYTFSPSTTIASAQVNTNTSDVAGVFTGLEAKTKSFSNLQIDATPTAATDAAIKSYVDKLNNYRRPVLQFTNITTVAVESGLDGTSGDIPLLFPDGTLRTETSTTRTSFVITRNAVLTTSGAQSGLTGATSEATNTWYALYGVKVTDSSTQWVTVGSTVLPIQANYSTLNTAYGSNGWVYLGLIRNGDNSGTTGDILSFLMNGNFTMFRNVLAVSVGSSGVGTRLATTAGANTLTYTYSAGTGTTNVPNNIGMAIFVGCFAARVAAVWGMDNAAGTLEYVIAQGAAADVRFQVLSAAVDGLQIYNTAAVTSDAMDINLVGFYDSVLGIGANPTL